MQQAIVAANASRGGLGFGLGRRYSADVRALTASARGRQEEAKGIRESFSGFSGFGDAGDQALRNSVVDVVVYVGDANRVFFYDARLAQALTDRLNNSGFRVINLDASNLGSFGGGGTIRVRAQILTDGYATANDAASVIAGAAAALGYNATGSSGVVVSTGGAASSGTTGASGQVYNAPAPGGASDVGDQIKGFVQNLTSSPTTLAVILGAAVILVIAAKGR